MNIGRIYRLLPTSPIEIDSGMVRVVDNEGEDYLYPSGWFETVSANERIVTSLTIYLNDVSKLAIRDLANAQGVSMSSLVRQWLEERLDLPSE